MHAARVAAGQNPAIAPAPAPDGTPDAPLGDPGLRGESRWPVVVAALVVVVLPFLMPEKFTPGPVWLVPLVESGLLLAMLIADPGRIDRHSTRIHALRLTFVTLLALGAAFAVGNLTVEILHGGKIVKEPTELLWAAVLVFTDIVISFAFVYWELADGGPGYRANNPVPHPDLAFVQHTSPELARPGWRPVFVDYLYLSLTNSIAFSPTDTMPLAHWAKLIMGAQSAVALVLVGLVVAQAVNVL